MGEVISLKERITLNHFKKCKEALLAFFDRYRADSWVACYMHVLMNSFFEASEEACRLTKTTVSYGLSGFLRTVSDPRRSAAIFRCHMRTIHGVRAVRFMSFHMRIRPLSNWGSAITAEKGYYVVPITYTKEELRFGSGFDDLLDAVQDLEIYKHYEWEKVFSLTFVMMTGHFTLACPQEDIYPFDVFGWRIVNDGKRIEVSAIKKMTDKTMLHLTMHLELDAMVKRYLELKNENA